MSEVFLYPRLGTDQSVLESSSRASKHLTWFKSKLNSFLRAYFDQKIKEASAIDPETVVLAEELRRFVLSGGKRIRPAFAYSAYLASGGRALDAIFYASAALEIFHAFALIHDDLIDHADVRRGEPSVHRVFEDFHKKRKWHGNWEDFGISTAILVGDLAFTYADELINTAPFPAERIRRAKEYYDLMKKQVIYGQYLDVINSEKRQVTEADLLKMLEYKTAKYTVERPLHIGAALAGAERDIFKVFTAYSVPLGQAFQIQDDIVGSFGSPEKIGKPVDSDIKEGKKTLLVIKAYENCKRDERQILDSVLGNRGAFAADVRKIQEIFRRSGALEYSQALSYQLINQAKEALSEVKLVREGKENLLQAADYLLTRSI